jgi:TRAP-type C4-dicarboxylate transport system permease small subunit
MAGARSGRGALAAAIGALRWLVNAFVVLCFSYMVLAVVVQVLGRYVLPIRIGNAVESATFAQIWLTAIGASVALREGAIFAVDTLTRRLDLTGARILSVVICLLNLGFLAVMIYGGVLLVERGMIQTSPVLLIPMWTIFISIPIGMSLLALEVVLHVVENWDAPFAQAAEEPL